MQLNTLVDGWLKWENAIFPRANQNFHSQQRVCIIVPCLMLLGKLTTKVYFLFWHFELKILQSAGGAENTFMSVTMVTWTWEKFFHQNGLFFSSLSLTLQGSFIFFMMSWWHSRMNAKISHFESEKKGVKINLKKWLLLGIHLSIRIYTLVW